MSELEKREQRVIEVNQLLEIISRHKPGHFARSRFAIEDGQIVYWHRGHRRTLRQPEWPGHGATLRRFGRALGYYIAQGKKVACNSSLLEATTSEPAELLKAAVGSPVIDWRHV